MDNAGSVRAAGKLLENVTPLNKNCGHICGERCCKDSEAGEGMLLFPGEETLYPKYSNMFSISKIKRPFFSFYITCGGICDRSLRPLACRFFPLVPFAEQKEGGFVRGVRIDTRAWPICPLNQSGITGLSQNFVEQAKEAASILLDNKEIFKYIVNLTKLIDSYKNIKETGNML